MSIINTILGPVDASDLGFTLMHEHIRESSAGVPYTFPDLFDHEEDVARGVAALNEAAAEGVGTIVNVTTLDLGRDMRLLKDVAERTELHIVAATGLWLDIPRAIANGATPDQLARVFTREIEVGIEGTGIKAGVIKVATDVQHISEEGLAPANELVLRAAARACNHTGVPITTHTSSLAKTGDYQIAVFEEEGVDMSRVCIGHSNDTNDLDYLLGIINKGCFLGMDHFPGGARGGLNWEERTQVVKQLVDLGFANQVTLSHDYGGWRPALPETVGRRGESNPDGYSFVSRKVVPRLMELGVNEEAVRAMTVDAPRRFFGD
ncbi:MAG: phosphotriesterase-related protein [Dehalococcoidia bacterium]|jgi:phosphotriesterase-related protein|nr:phosphotriesterase-related protein [Dehalococcoidia bacterium]